MRSGYEITFKRASRLTCFTRFIWVEKSTTLFICGARLTGLPPVNESRLTPKSFVKISMCSYEGARWLGYRDLGFSNRDLGKRAGNFAI